MRERLRLEGATPLALTTEEEAVNPPTQAASKSGKAFFPENLWKAPAPMLAQQG